MKTNWIKINNISDINEYEWVLLGLSIDDDEHDMAWQIGRRINDILEFWGDNNGGPYQSDAFYTWDPVESTHYLPIFYSIDI